MIHVDFENQSFDPKKIDCENQNFSLLIYYGKSDGDRVWKSKFPKIVPGEKSKFWFRARFFKTEILIFTLCPLRGYRGLSFHKFSAFALPRNRDRTLPLNILLKNRLRRLLLYIKLSSVDGIFPGVISGVVTPMWYKKINQRWLPLFYASFFFRSKF